MKNILIGGPARSGKSTFATLLSQKYSYNVLRGDMIMSALLSTHPEIEIDRTPDSHEQALKERTPFLLALLKELTEHDSLPYVLDSDWITPEIVNKSAEIANYYHIIFFGYPQIAHSEKLKLIKEFASGAHCVSNQLSENELSHWVAFWINESIKIELKCKEYGYNFVDTSINFKTAIDSAFRYID